jgi:hypothetical protein
MLGAFHPNNLYLDKIEYLFARTIKCNTSSEIVERKETSKQAVCWYQWYVPADGVLDFQAAPHRKPLLFRFSRQTPVLHTTHVQMYTEVFEVARA